MREGGAIRDLLIGLERLGLENGTVRNVVGKAPTIGQRCLERKGK
jgi:hypothetical protein